MECSLSVQDSDVLSGFLLVGCVLRASSLVLGA